MASENQEAIDFLNHKGIKLKDTANGVELSCEYDFAEIMMEFARQYSDDHNQGEYGRQDY